MSAMAFEPKIIRAKGGRFVSRACPDPNCSGLLVDDGEGWLRCDGLTYVQDHEELRDCHYIVEGLRPQRRGAS